MRAESTYYVQSLEGGGSMSLCKFSIPEAAQRVGMLLRKNMVVGVGHSKKGAEASVCVFFCNLSNSFPVIGVSPAASTPCLHGT